MFNVTLGLHWFHFTLLCVLRWKVVPPRQPIRNKCKPISALSPVPSWASNLVQIQSLNSDDIFVIDLLPRWCAMVTMRLLVGLQSRCALAVTECVVYIKSYQISVPLLQTHDQNKVYEKQRFSPERETKNLRISSTHFILSKTSLLKNTGVFFLTWLT